MVLFKPWSAAANVEFSSGLSNLSGRCLSVSLTLLFLMPTGPATAPESLSVVSFNVSSLGVTWQRPNNIAINGILRNYVLKYCLTGDEGVPITNSCVMLQNISQDTTTKILTGLKHYTTYSIHIAAMTIDTGPFASRIQTTGLCEESMLTNITQG